MSVPASGARRSSRQQLAGRRGRSSDELLRGPRRDERKSTPPAVQVHVSALPCLSSRKSSPGLVVDRRVVELSKRWLPT